MNSLNRLALPPVSAFSSLLPALYAVTPAPVPPVGMQWIAVRQRFQQFHNSLTLTPRQFLDGMTKRNGVVSCLNRRYYGSASDTDNSFLVGSWGKETAMRPPRDVDLYFILPVSVYTRFQSYLWNPQSALLQEVKAVLAGTYPGTDMRGDGQVVIVRFESYNVEVVPAFLLKNGRYWICDTDQGGAYREADPWSELNYINTVDQATNGNLRPLIRMLKAWQTQCTVPIKSFQLELVAADFISQSPWRLYDYFWFDWITRDFFAYLYHRAHTSIVVPGTHEQILLGDAWQSRAESAYWQAEKACDHERYNRVEAAGEEWQKIFGTRVPRTV
jgi:Second Messenger Oligonucleotide or Dinucleotide Synthetase domain